MYVMYLMYLVSHPAPLQTDSPLHPALCLYSGK